MSKCDCPEEATATQKSLYAVEEYKAMSHEAGRCPGDWGLRQYQREGQTLTLCSACNLPGDALLDEGDA